MKQKIYWSLSESIAPVQIEVNDVQEAAQGARAMRVSDRTRVVLEDLKTRESKRRLRNWREMLGRYVDTGQIERRHVKCPKCGRVVDMVCDECLEGDRIRNEDSASIFCGHFRPRLRRSG